VSAPEGRRLPEVRVTKKGLERLSSGHPWIYRTDLSKPPNLPQGGAVRILDLRGHFAALAHYSGVSKIALRLLSLNDQPIDRAFWAGRLSRAIALRDRIFPEADARRVVHGESDLLPGLIADQYGKAVSIQTLTPAMDQLKGLWAELLTEQLGATAIVERNDGRSRALEGLPVVQGMLKGSPPGLVEYHEGPVRLLADPLEGQKTGAFLDQRENHLAAVSYARGDCLDCFSYHGAFALQLARHAKAVTAIEMSAPAAARISEAATRNQFTNIAVRESNVFDLLRDEIDRGTRYDTVVLDPPGFAKTKDRLESAIRGYKEINLRALQLLRPGGTLITCSCSYYLSAEAFEEMLRGAASDAKRPVQIVERRGASRDHPSLLGAPETRYLKCLIARVLE
jgi:23S rRNA (cytosine1962-C5)-methyltransferase